MAKDCITPLMEKTAEENANIERFTKISDKWFNNSIIKSTTGGRHKEFITFYEQTLPHLNFKYSRLPNAKELSKLERIMDKYLKDLSKEPTMLGRLFKLPEAVLKKNPVTKRYFDELVLASNFHRGNMENITADLQLIKKNLNKATGHVSMFNKFGFGRSKAQAEIQRLEKEWKRIKNQDGKEAADKYYAENLADLSNKSDHLATLHKLWELLNNPDLMLKQNKAQTELKYGPELIEAASVWHFGVAGARGGSKLREPLKIRLWKLLANGIQDNISMLERMQTDYNMIDFKIEKLKQLQADYFDLKNPHSMMKNYFPRQVLDIAPTFAKLSDDIHSGYAQNNPKAVSKYIERMVQDVSNNLKTPGNVFERGIDAPTKVSKDVLDIIDTYTNNVVRFNYNARVSKATTKALQDLNNLKTQEHFDQHLKILTDYIMDTHESAIGVKFRNSKLANISRAITSWQFISKLGLNLRTVARNATQSLQNFVYFGGTAIYKAMKDMQTGEMKDIISREMNRHGFEFVNIQEFAMPKDLMSNLKIDDTGKVIEVNPNIGNKVNNWFEEIARVSGKPMQWVENNVNRGLTFKLAFMERYDYLTSKDGGGDAYIRKVLAQNRENRRLSTEEMMEKVKSTKIRQASNYAANMVKELHYLYDPWAKPQILRSPVGSVLGQFSTYSINFFEYQRKIAAAGGNEILAGQWNSPEAWRLYRLGMLYSAVTGIGAITNTKWSNLVQNDTFERLTRLDQYLRGDAEAREKAYFGKDPITATFGGPFISDLIAFGHLVNFQKMSGHDLQSYLEQYRYNAEQTKHSGTEDLVRTLNTQIGRLIYDTVPSVINGTGFMTALGQELALYNTKDLNTLRDQMLYPLQKHLPKPIGQYFTPEKMKPKDTGRFSAEEIDRIMMALGDLRNTM